MEISQFDPAVFLTAQQTEVNERRPTVPAENPDDANGLYTAMIGEVKGGGSGVISKGDNAGNPWVSMVVPLKLQLPPQVQSLGLPSELQITDRVFLDLTPQGSIDNGKGKNRGQKAYRDATGLNKAGEVFSWSMLQGKLVKVKIAHELYNGAITEKVSAVLPA